MRWGHCFSYSHIQPLRNKNRNRVRGKEDLTEVGAFRGKKEEEEQGNSGYEGCGYNAALKTSSSLTRGVRRQRTTMGKCCVEPQWCPLKTGSPKLDCILSRKFWGKFWVPRLVEFATKQSCSVRNMDFCQAIYHGHLIVDWRHLWRSQQSCISGNWKTNCNSCER